MVKNLTQQPIKGSSTTPCREPLPIDKCRDVILEAILTQPNAIFVGETASGKSTRIPQMCLEAGFSEDGMMVAVTEPRRVAAQTLASRVAYETGTELGKLIGYRFRFEELTSGETKLVYLTDGILLREALHDPKLGRYSAILIDEAHERSIYTDVLMMVLRRAQIRRRKSWRRFSSSSFDGHQSLTPSEQQAQLKQLLPPLRVYLMSATINPDKFSNYFNGAPVYHIRGRTHPVHIFNAEQLSCGDNDYLFNALSVVLRLHKTEPIENGFLVFLTGREEIETALHVMKRERRHHSFCANIAPLGLYSMMSTQAQARAFLPLENKGERKVVFATNIAETSITIPDIRVVIDSGKVKQKLFSPHSQVEVLRVVDVSKTQSIQRAGRAGRLGRGKCYRLYSSTDYEKFVDEPDPEILRSSLASVVLELISMGLPVQPSIKTMDPPDPELTGTALDELISIGAVEFDVADFECENINGKETSFESDQQRPIKRPIDASPSSSAIEPSNENFRAIKPRKKRKKKKNMNQETVEFNGYDGNVEEPSSSNAFCVPISSSSNTSNKNDSSLSNGSNCDDTSAKMDETSQRIRKQSLRLTDLGSRLVRFPLEPRHALILMEAEGLGCLDDALIVVSYLSTGESIFQPSCADLLCKAEDENDVETSIQSRFQHRQVSSNSVPYSFVRGSSTVMNGANWDATTTSHYAPEGDLVLVLRMFRAYSFQKQHLKSNITKLKEWCTVRDLNMVRLDNVAKIRKQLHEICTKEGMKVRCNDHIGNEVEDDESFKRLRKAVFLALKPNACLLKSSPSSNRQSSFVVEYQLAFPRQTISNSAGHLFSAPSIGNSSGNEHFCQIRIHPSSCLVRERVRAFVFSELVQTTEVYARNICLIDEGWLAEEVERRRHSKASAIDYSPLPLKNQQQPKQEDQQQLQAKRLKKIKKPKPDTSEFDCEIDLNTQLFPLSANTTPVSISNGGNACDEGVGDAIRIQTDNDASGMVVPEETIAILTPSEKKGKRKKKKKKIEKKLLAKTTDGTEVGENQKKKKKKKRGNIVLEVEEGIWKNGESPGSGANPSGVAVHFNRTAKKSETMETGLIGSSAMASAMMKLVDYEDTSSNNSSGSPSSRASKGSIGAYTGSGASPSSSLSSTPSSSSTCSLSSSSHNTENRPLPLHTMESKGNKIVGSSQGWCSRK